MEVVRPYVRVQILCVQNTESISIVSKVKDVMQAFLSKFHSLIVDVNDDNIMYKAGAIKDLLHLRDSGDNMLTSTELDFILSGLCCPRQCSYCICSTLYEINTLLLLLLFACTYAD